MDDPFFFLVSVNKEDDKIPSGSQVKDPESHGSRKRILKTYKLRKRERSTSLTFGESG